MIYLVYVPLIALWFFGRIFVKWLNKPHAWKIKAEEMIQKGIGQITIVMALGFCFSWVAIGYVFGILIYVAMTLLPWALGFGIFKILTFKKSDTGA